MRFTDNAELTAENMTNADILAGTDVSEQTDKKFSLAGLADWFLNRFTGLSLAGKNQSVKAALDELNSNLRCESFAESCTWNSNLDVTQAWKTGHVVQLIVRAKSSTTHAEGEVICEIPEGYRPAYTMYTTMYMQGGVQAVVQVSAAGKCVLYLAPSYPTGRYYANIVYTLA